MSAAEHPDSRFELAPPRNFLLPALLLLIAEEPNHGYQLVKELNGLHFGRFDRPSVYRILGQLAEDRLVDVWEDGEPAAGSPRRVYGITDEGARVLREWMGVIREERDVLDHVLHRYASARSVDALLAEAGGGLVAVGGTRWSPVAATSGSDHRPKHVDAPGHQHDPAREGGQPEPTDGRRRYRLVPDRSAVMIEARSTVGPISFGTLGLTGEVEVDVIDGQVVADHRPAARVEIPVTELRSGNGLYDAELARRIHATRYPTVELDLDDCAALGVSSRYRLAGHATLHGVTRPVEGTVAVDFRDEHSLSVSGEQVFDIRDFDIESPTVLMLRIYPDVTVRLHVEAERDDV